jgi:phosphoglycerate dehydrogenase-like enzyme
LIYYRLIDIWKCLAVRNMTRIVFLQTRDKLDKVFTPKLLERIRGYGEVVTDGFAGVNSAQRMQRLIEGADIAITSWGCLPLTEEILVRAPQLKAVLHAAGSVKGIVTPELWRRGIRVSSGAEAIAKGVGESALGLTICSLKDFWRLSRHTQAGGWDENLHRVKELHEITIGVIGAGRTGKHYIRLLQNFDVEVLVYDPFISESDARKLGAAKSDLDALLARSDVVSIHAPSLPETRHMINRERLALMNDDCILINTARGSIIDEEALAEELGKGRLFACLDVTEPEPPAPDHPFRTLPNVILTPHIAGATNNGLHRLGRYVADELQAFLEGRLMDGEVNEEQLRILA